MNRIKSAQDVVNYLQITACQNYEKISYALGFLNLYTYIWLGRPKRIFQLW